MNNRCNTCIGKNRQRGYVLLLAAIIATIVTTLGVLIIGFVRSDLALAGSSQESDLAFYAAESVARCGQYYEYSSTHYDSFRVNDPSRGVDITCMNITKPLGTAVSGQRQDFEFEWNTSASQRACSKLVVVKTVDSGVVLTQMVARGYSAACDQISSGTGKDIVERSIVYDYADTDGISIPRSIAFSDRETITQSVPTITSPLAIQITSTGATLGGTVSSDGNANITARGTCWGTTNDPTTNCLSTTGTTGIFSHTRTGMAENTTYYYRAYATNALGTGYSPSATFQTLDTTPNAITFTGVTNASVNTLVTSNAVTLGGFDGPLTASCANCTAIGRNGSFTSGTSLSGFMSGDTMQLQRYSSASGGTTVTALVTLGNTTSNTWSITTNVPPGSQTFTSSGTFTVPSGVTSVQVTIAGGGGGGVGGGYEGGGGGGGAEVKMQSVSVTPGSTIIVTVGNSGNGSSQRTTAGNGGNSSFGGLITAQGGRGASWSTGGLAGGSGGTNGSNGACCNNRGGGGAGGSSYGGAGGSGASAGTCGNGSSGVNRGSGGGGGAGGSNCGSYGGNGANGIIIVSW